MVEDRQWLRMGYMWNRGVDKGEVMMIDRGRGRRWQRGKGGCRWLIGIRNRVREEEGKRGRGRG